MFTVKAPNAIDLQVDGDRNEYEIMPQPTRPAANNSTSSCCIPLTCVCLTFIIIGSFIVGIMWRNIENDKIIKNSPLYALIESNTTRLYADERSNIFQILTFDFANGVIVWQYNSVPTTATWDFRFEDYNNIYAFTYSKHPQDPVYKSMLKIRWVNSITIHINFRFQSTDNLVDNDFIALR